MKKARRFCEYNLINAKLDDHGWLQPDLSESPWEWCAECGRLLDPRTEKETPGVSSCICTRRKGAQRIPIGTLVEACRMAQHFLPNLTVEALYALCLGAESQDWMATASAQELASWALKDHSLSQGL
ncbi:MAG: hypothetical protein HYY20_13955 [Candidatus Tectomicrobia bacterium]|uniref:Uncharacterized protein n=1 Tax=Tectimicrobiota bacterium TaxID=2528274 RepID=A0A932CR52_UNCTE|nr:hypothetical protein [Candidatus Tectomicrobia bacterium]